MGSRALSRILRVFSPLPGGAVVWGYSTWRRPCASRGCSQRLDETRERAEPEVISYTAGSYDTPEERQSGLRRREDAQENRLTHPE